MNSRDDFLYRRELAEGFLKEAEDDFRLKRYRSCVDNSQLCLENAAKAIVALFEPVEKTHTPEEQLSKLLLEKEIEKEIREKLKEFLPLWGQLGFREHILSDYGDESERITPWRLFGEEEARTSLAIAQRGIAIVDEIKKLLSLECNC
ncbi:MAG: HEPN domain-containing protein [Candidatus Edwardsbacteria bacterium]